MLWTRYVQLTPDGERVSLLKREWNIRPIYHQIEQRAEAHILIAFLAYCLQVTLKNRLMIHAPGLTAPAVLEKLATIPMVEVWIPTLDPRWLILPRHTHAGERRSGCSHQIHIHFPPLPPQPPIKAAAIPKATVAAAVG